VVNSTNLTLDEKVQDIK